MLSKANRLTKEADFKLLAKKGRPFYSSLFTIKLLKSKDTDSRFGVVISSKVSKKAVVRNKIKRRITEVIRLSMPKIKSGFDVMILVKSIVAEKSYQEIKEDIEKLFKKAQLLK